MTLTEIIKAIMAEKNTKTVDLARRLGTKKATIHNRINQENISFKKMDEMIRTMDYKIMIVPTGTKCKGYEVVFDDEDKGES